MSDSAFKSAPFAGFTSRELEARVAQLSDDDPKRYQMLAEIARRERVAAGDRSVMTAGERLRYAQKSRG